jgi:hypothetical protein
MSAVSDLEPVVHDLRSTVGILGHLITANSSVTNEVDDNAWRKVESDLISLAERFDQLWQTVWDQRVATAAEHEAALAAAMAEAAPGSPADIKQAEALWSMLRAVMKVAGEECDKVRGLTGEAGR